MGRLELPMPKLGRSTQFLESHANDMQERIRARVPKEFRNSVVVRPFRRRGSSGLAVEYDDKIEALVFSAIEDPGSGQRETTDQKA